MVCGIGACWRRYRSINRIVIARTIRTAMASLNSHTIRLSVMTAVPQGRARRRGAFQLNGLEPIAEFARINALFPVIQKSSAVELDEALYLPEHPGRHLGD